MVLTAQNADVAQTTVGVTYLRSMTNVKTDTCPLYVHHRHTCAWPTKKQLFACHCSVETKGLLLWNAVLAFTKQWHAESEFLLVVPKAASGARRNYFSVFHYKQILFTPCTLTLTRTIFTTPRRTCDL